MSDRTDLLLCELIEKMGAVLDASGFHTGGGEVTSLILPVTIGDNDPQLFSAANQGRVGVVIHNKSGSQLFIALSSSEVEVSKTYYSFIIEPDDHLILDQKTLLETYKGEIWGIWADGATADSRAMVTELSIQGA